MTSPELFDLIELIVDVPKAGLRIGDQGNIVEIMGEGQGYMVEFVDDEGYTTHLIFLEPQTFLVVRRHEKKENVSTAEQTAEITARLPDENSQRILDFVRYQYARTVPPSDAEAFDGSFVDAQQDQRERELVAAD